MPRHNYAATLALLMSHVCPCFPCAVGTLTELLIVPIRVPAVTTGPMAMTALGFAKLSHACDVPLEQVDAFSRSSLHVIEVYEGRQDLKFFDGSI